MINNETNIENIGYVAGYGKKANTYFQSLEQLIEIYGENMENKQQQEKNYNNKRKGVI